MTTKIKILENIKHNGILYKAGEIVQGDEFMALVDSGIAEVFDGEVKETVKETVDETKPKNTWGPTEDKKDETVNDEKIVDETKEVKDDEVKDSEIKDVEPVDETIKEDKKEDIDVTGDTL